jgi:hypothetical protein
METNKGNMNRNTEERIVKIPLPLALIRNIDEAIVSGLGGFSTRPEFFREAAEGLLVELKYEPAPAEPLVPNEQRPGLPADARHSASDGSGQEPAASETLVTDQSKRGPLIGLDGVAATALRFGDDGVAVSRGEADVDDEPLFGMHNRDFPSLWVAFRLAQRSKAGPVDYERFVAEVTEEAWAYADALRPIEEQAGQKLTALFPTNRAKPQSAAEAFRVFAFGTVARAKDGGLRAEGPLFAWRTCQVKRGDGGDVLVGLTSEGWQLLRSLDGISLELPHAPELARTFLEHLRRHTPGDWWGFQAVLTAVTDEPNRVELVETFRRERPDWNANVAATNAQGYVARAREWGLVQPKQVAGRYGLTEFGAAYLTDASNDNHAITNN